MNGDILDELYALVNQLEYIIKGKEGKKEEAPFKVAVGSVKSDIKGWVRVEFTDVTGVKITLNNPSISCVTEGASRWFKKPTITIPKVEIKVPRITVSPISIKEFTLPEISIPTVTLPTIGTISVRAHIKDVPNIPKITKIPPERIISFTCKGKTYRTTKWADAIWMAVYNCYSWPWWVSSDMRKMIADTVSFVGKVIDWIQWEKSLKQMMKDMSNEVIDYVNNKLISNINNNLDEIVSKFTESLEHNLNVIINGEGTIKKHKKDLITYEWDGKKWKLVVIARDFKGVIPQVNEVITTIQDNINTGLQNMKDLYERNIRTAWNNQIREIGSKISEFRKNVQEALDKTTTNVELEINRNIEVIRKNLENSIQEAVNIIWEILGLEKGITFNPVMVRNVTDTGFEVYSTGPGFKMYYIAIGR